MKRKSREIKLLVGLLLSVAVAVSASNCDKKSDSEIQSMVIVNTSGAATVVKAGVSTEAKVGMLVAKDDVIKTQKGMVDLQTKSGSAVRVKEFTTLTVSNLYGGKSKDTQLSMQHGSLMANVDKRGSEESFKVTTPTAIAGVRGTTFTVESNEGEPTRVKVLNGKVAMSPRFTALEKVSAAEIKADKNLQKLKELQEKSEVVVEEESAGELNASVEEVVRDLNTETNKVETKVEVSAVVEKAFTKVEASTEKDIAVKIEKEEVTVEERMEKETMVTVDEDKIEKIQAGGDTTQVVAQITEERKVKQEQVIKRIEEQASKTALANEDEIKKQYNKLEVVNLRNGTSIRGAVIAQTGSVMVIHTTKGVKRVQTSDVDSISFP